MIRTVLASLIPVILLVPVEADANAHGERGFPCISCDAYDYGWMYAAENGFRKLSDCEPAEEDDGVVRKQSDDDDDEEDEDAAEDNAFNEGCKDYVLSSQKHLNLYF